MSMSKGLLIVRHSIRTILYECNNYMSLVLYTHGARFIGKGVQCMLEGKKPLCLWIMIHLLVDNSGSHILLLPRDSPAGSIGILVAWFLLKYLDVL